MTSQQFDEETVFHVARRISDANARSDYLDQICEDDLNLRRRVEALLGAHEEEQDFLKSADDPGPTVDLPSVDESPGQMIGRYKLREELGAGGFGVVWAAEQTEPVRRKVALKIIKPGMDTQTVVARFEAERQALALMDHQNIARVLDAGTTKRGRPYFVMELIRGVPITEYCNENKLTIHERLELFIGVCRAVQHAHQKGIIHRDIKPSNVLVTLHDGMPVPKVIDFGIAKALNQRLTDKSIYTCVHQAVGTLAYMSPEQAELSGLDIDTRADVYGLGVLLYELLTGTTPFDKKRLEEAALHEACRIIREEEPPKPSTRISTLGETATAVSAQRKTDPRDLRQLVQGDLDWILMRALEKDRTRRYEMASSLAADVERCLRDEPIEARPPSNWYRLCKYWRRHTSFVVGVSAMLAILVLGIVGTTTGWIVARDAHQQAEHEAKKAKQTLYDLRTTLFDQGVDYVLAANPQEANRIRDRLEDLGAHDLAVKLQAVLLHNAQRFEEAVQLLEDAVAENPDDAGLLAMLADAYDGAGDIIGWFRSHQLLRELDHEKLTPVERVYAALSYIMDPKYGYELANEAVAQRPGSPIARHVRGRMLAAWALRGARPELVEEAVEDVNSVSWLLGSDKRYPGGALLTYILAANTSRAAGDPQWDRHLEAARDVIDYIENRGPSNWERFYLADYYYNREQYETALAHYRDAAKRDRNDYNTNFYLALACELEVKPDSDVLARFQSGELKAFGLAGFGCLRATEGNVDEATEAAHRLVEKHDGSVDALLLGAEILLLAGKSDEAEALVRRNMEHVSGPHSSVSSEWMRDTLLQYYARGWEDQKLVDRARKSPYPGQFLSYAYWTIALKHLAEHDEDGAKENFRKCFEQRMYFLHTHAWSRALLKWLERNDDGSHSNPPF